MSDFAMLSSVKGTKTKTAANLTTRDVARLLLVSEATVKRWTDSGLLLPEKTLGGHRRFSIQSVARLRREQGIAPAAQSPAKRTRKQIVGSLPSAESFSELLLSDNEAEAAAQDRKSTRLNSSHLVISYA